MDFQSYCCFLHFISIKDEENRILCFSFSGIYIWIFNFFLLSFYWCVFVKFNTLHNENLYFSLLIYLKFYWQDDGGLILDSVTIERTEMLILGALKWRMRSVNPFSFISFFITLFGIEDQTSIRALKDGAREIILRAQNG